MIIVVIGVSASGKSTLGQALASALSWKFIEGDAFHPPENVAKMRRGVSLDDADRAPWLAELNRQIARLDDAGSDGVLACSALRKHYRDALREGIRDIRFVYLCGDPEMIRARLQARKGHFMPTSLLDSQIATLEPPQDAVLVPIELPTGQQVELVRQALTLESDSMKNYQAEPVATGLAFPEGPRWRDGRFWFTDQHARRIYSMDASGALQIVAHTTDLPGGLGWLPDGTMLVVYMTERRIMRLSGGELHLYADLSQHARFHCNDMVVDAAGRIYAGNFGFDLHGGEARCSTEIVLVDVDGAIEHFATDVVFPNGSVITPDGKQLLVAETFAHRISAFQLNSAGRMQSRQVWADLGEAIPDGICLDQEGALWVASPGTRELLRLKRGGAILARCTTRGTPYACMLGGEDRRTLFACTSETDDPEQAAQLKTGRIERVEVEVPGAGLP